MRISNIGGNLKKFLVESLKILCVALALFPMGIKISEFLGFFTLTEFLYLHSPTAFYSDERIESFLHDVKSRDLLRVKQRGIDAPGFRLIVPADFQESDWVNTLRKATASFSRLLPGIIPFKPTIVLQPLDGAEGSFDGLRLLIDPDGPDPMRTMLHELTHCYLFWALFPGLPFDCPRWFNEGMAEELSGILFQGIDERWIHEMIPDSFLVPFSRLSPAFSWNGYIVDLQARHAFHRFVDEFGWDGVMRIIKGLQAARPFRSVFQQAFRQFPEAFEKACFSDFIQTRLISRLSLEQVVAHLKWSVHGAPENVVTPQLKEAMRLWPENRELKDLRLQLMDESIGRFLRAGNPAQALGVLSNKRDLFDRPTFEKRFAEIRARIGTPSALPAPIFISRRFGVLSMVTALFLTYLAIGFYRFLRRHFTRVVGQFWYPAANAALRFRWFTVIGFAWGSAWFTRLLMIGFTPYLGLHLGTDFRRILGAESLVVLLWIGLLWQFQRWDNPRTDMPVGETATSCCIPDTCPSWASSTAFSGNPTDPPNIGIAKEPFMNGLILPAFSWFPALLAFFDGSLQRIPTSWVEYILAAFSNSVVLLGSDLLLFSLCRRWARRFPRMTLWLPACGFALLRGGISFQCPGSLWLLILGRLFSGKAAENKPMRNLLALDFLCFFPQIFLVPAGFLQFDPVGGLFWNAAPREWEYLIPLVISSVALLTHLQDKRKGILSYLEK